MNTYITQSNRREDPVNIFHFALRRSIFRSVVEEEFFVNTLQLLGSGYISLMEPILETSRLFQTYTDIEMKNSVFWITNIDHFLRKLSNESSRHIWSLNVFWTQDDMDRKTQYMTCCDDKYLTSYAPSAFESENDLFYSGIPFVKKNMFRVENKVYTTYTLEQSIRIMESFFGKDNIALGYQCRMVRSKMTLSILLYISDYKKYEKEYAFTMDTLPWYKNNVFGYLSENEQKEVVDMVTLFIQATLADWFPCLGQCTQNGSEIQKFWMYRH